MTYLKVVRSTTYTKVVRSTTYTKVVQDFIPRFWSNLAYLGRLQYKSSTGRLSSKSSRINVLFFNCKSNLKRITWKSSSYNKIMIFFFGFQLDDLWVSHLQLDDLRVSRTGKVKFLTQSGQMQN